MDYMFCRNFKTGEAEIFFANQNGKNEIKELLSSRNDLNQIFVHPLGEIFSLGEFTELYDFYQDKMMIGKEPTKEEMQQQIEIVCLRKNKNKQKLFRK